MALINCPECGTQLSDKAVTCPKCGHPMIVEVEGTGTKAFRFGWMGVAVIALVIALLALLNTCNWKPV